MGRTFLDPVLKPLERLVYKLTGVDSAQRAGLEALHLAMLLFSAVSTAFHLCDPAFTGGLAV